MSTSSNPFADLANTFRKDKGGKSSASGASGSVSKTGTAVPAPKAAAASAGNTGRASRHLGKGGKRVDEAPDLGEEEALFLNAVQPITPLHRDKAKDGAGGLNGLGCVRSLDGADGVRSLDGADGDDNSFAEILQSALPQTGQPGKKRAPAQGASKTDPPSGTPKGPVLPADLPEHCFTVLSPEAPREEDAFSKAMQGVAPLAAKGRAIAPPAAVPETGAPAADPAKALRDLLEGRVEFALYHSDEYMEGHVVGVDPAILVRMRSGQLSPEAHLDLHGQNARQAFDALTLFIKSAYQRSLRTVIVVTGRGKNSPGGVSVLRSMLQEWLTKDPFKRVVLAFCTAHPQDGGPGAVYVLLRKYKKSRGKIIWEHTAPEADIS